jgi:hypothetical protein
VRSLRRVRKQIVEGGVDATTGEWDAGESMQIGAMRLFPAVSSSKEDTLISATGVSSDSRLLTARDEAPTTPSSCWMLPSPEGGERFVLFWWLTPSRAVQ